MVGDGPENLVQPHLWPEERLVWCERPTSLGADLAQVSYAYKKANAAVESFSAPLSLFVGLAWLVGITPVLIFLLWFPLGLGLAAGGIGTAILSVDTLGLPVDRRGREELDPPCARAPPFDRCYSRRDRLGLTGNQLIARSTPALAREVRDRTVVDADADLALHGDEVRLRPGVVFEAKNIVATVVAGSRERHGSCTGRGDRDGRTT